MGLWSVVALVVMAGPRVVASPACVLDAKQVFFHVQIRSEWMEESQIKSQTKIYQLRCDRRTKQCSGSVLNVDPLNEENGKLVVNFLDLSTMSGAKLESVVGRIAVISWGVHQFIFDIDAGTVTKSAESFGGVPERGVGRCAVASP